MARTRFKGVDSIRISLLFIGFLASAAAAQAHVTIQPRESQQFPFTASNPTQGAQIAWKVHRHFANGTSSDWVGPVGDRRPASVTTLVAQ